MDTQYIPLRDVAYVLRNRDEYSDGQFYLIVADSLPLNIKVADKDASYRLVEADPDTRRPLAPLVKPAQNVSIH